MFNPAHLVESVSGILQNSLSFFVIFILLLLLLLVYGSVS